MKNLYKYLLLIINITLSAGYNFGQKNFTVQVSNFEFTPKDIIVTIGDTVSFQWVSGIHTTTSDSTIGPDSWNSPISSSIPVYKVIIHYPGLHRYYCIPHGSSGGVGMAGTVTAVPKAPTAVEKSNNTFSYYLEQNYPNPFNPSTKINYAILENSMVTLKVYNSLGEVVATLINENQTAGRYSVVFNASDLSSGIYYYQLRAGLYISVRKMSLIK